MPLSHDMGKSQQNDFHFKSQRSVVYCQMVEDYWESSKKMLADNDFLKSLREYDKDNIDPIIIGKIRP